MLTFIICKYAEKLKDEISLPGTLAFCVIADAIILTTLAVHI